MLLWGKRSDIIQADLKSLSSYSTFSASFDAITLLKEIKAIAYSFRDQKNPQALAWRALRGLFACYMQENNTPQENLNRISNHVEILEGMGMSIGEYPVLAQKDEEYMAQ